MAHYNVGGDPLGGQDVYVAAAMEAKANLRKQQKAEKAALQKKKTQRASAKAPALQTQLSNQGTMRSAHSPRQSMPVLNTLNAQQLALQQGQLIMNTQLHQHRLRGQYFSAYEQKPWYCDCAGTNIGCAGGTVKGDFQFRDLAYWKCELDSRGLSKCGVTFCNACVIRDEKLSSSPMAAHQMSTPMMFSDPNMQAQAHARASASMGNMSGMGNNLLNRNMGGGASTSSVGSNLSAQEMAALQAANEEKGKKKSGKLGAKVYNEPGVVKKGWMLKRGNIVKSWKRRYFVLREDRQLYYYSNDSTSTVKGVAQFFEVEQVIKHDKQIFSVQLKGGKVWHFSCANEADRDDWCAKLKILCKAPVMVAKAKKGDKGDEKE